MVECLFNVQRWHGRGSLCASLGLCARVCCGTLIFGFAIFFALLPIACVLPHFADGTAVGGKSF